MTLNRTMIRTASVLCLAAVVCGGAAAQQATREPGSQTAGFQDRAVIVSAPVRVAAVNTAGVYGTSLEIVRDGVEAMESASSVFMLGLPLSATESVDLDLKPIEVYDARAEFVLGDGAAGARPNRKRVLALGGEVAGVPGSAAYLAITPTRVHGFVELDGVTHVISSGPATEGVRPVVYNLTDLPEGLIRWKPFECSALGAPDELLVGLPAAEGGTPPALLGAGGEEEPDPCRVIDVAIETDVEFGLLFGGGEDALTEHDDYVEALIGAINYIYLREINLRFNVIYSRRWIGFQEDADPWDGGTTSSQLSQLRAEWLPNDAPTAAVWRGVHLLSGRNLGGGIAFLRAICNQSIGHAVSADLSGSFPIVPRTDGVIQPVNNNNQNWDVVVTAHEWGHNLGAPHTHGLNPVQDSCGLGDCALSESGTIMSYCHICPGGLSNIELVMGQRILSEGIRPYLLLAPCDLTANQEFCEGAPTDFRCLPDVNNDGRLTPSDFTAWIVAYNRNDIAADMNLDGLVRPNDFNEWLRLYNLGCDFPDP